MNFIDSVLTPDDIHRKVEEWLLDTGYTFEVYEDYKHFNMEMATTHSTPKGEEYGLDDYGKYPAWEAHWIFGYSNKTKAQLKKDFLNISYFLGNSWGDKRVAPFIKEVHSGTSSPFNRADGMKEHDNYWHTYITLWLDDFPTLEYLYAEFALKELNPKHSYF